MSNIIGIPDSMLWTLNKNNYESLYPARVKYEDQSIQLKKESKIRKFFKRIKRE